MKRPEKNSKQVIQLPVASVAEKLTAQSSVLRHTLSLPSELQVALESVITAEQLERTEEEPNMRYSDATFHNGEVPNSPVIM
jgi:hypothetical protein